MDFRPRPRSRSRLTRPQGPWKNGPIVVIGVTGLIGAGKSLVTGILAEEGALTLDADSVGHALLNQRPVREPVIARFGRTIVAPAVEPGGPPTIDRRALGAIVFADPSALRDLEAILHPRMRGTFERAIARAARRGKERGVVLDAAVLFEAGWNSLCDRVVFVDAPRDQRLARVASSRGWTDEMLTAREKTQWAGERKRALADVVVSNDGDPGRVAEAVHRVWTELVPSNRESAASRRSTAGGHARSSADPTSATNQK